MGPLKAPVPDGFQACFFQSTWQFTGPAIFNFTKKVLEKAELPPGSNDTLLILIPKEDKPTSMIEFRPISLVNVCVKLATKMLVNRPRGIWRVIIYANYASFVSGRQIVDNIIV